MRRNEASAQKMVNQEKFVPLASRLNCCCVHASVSAKNLSGKIFSDNSVQPELISTQFAYVCMFALQCGKTTTMKNKNILNENPTKQN